MNLTPFAFFLILTLVVIAGCESVARNCTVTCTDCKELEMTCHAETDRVEPALPGLGAD